MTTTKTLVERLLDKPTAPPVTGKSAIPAYTSRITLSGDTAETEAIVPEGDEPEDAARAVLTNNGLDPAEWVVTGFRASEWDGKTASRYTFARVGSSAARNILADQRPPIDEIVALLTNHTPSKVTVRAPGDHTFIVALGDMQFGKVDGDGAEGTLARTLEYLARAADTLAFYRTRFDIGHIHIAWLGDHVEGFVSQGGANTWRTRLTLNEQIRLTRRVMTEAMMLFAPLAARVTMVAVPGNHGEPQRFMGKGVTRYDDSHDTESLIAVSEAAALAGDAYSHVEFYVPETDELTVTLDLSGTITGHAHGHQFKPGKHFDWWKGQAFGGSPLADATLLLLGHLHHELVEDQSGKKVVQVPALEAESTWYRHAKGVTGNPGIVVAVTKDGSTNLIEVIR